MRFISYFLSSIFAVVFLSFLVIFQPLQWLSHRIFGLKYHAKVVAILNFFLVKSMLILGIPIYYKNEYEIPDHVPLIIVSNHQSTFDIPPLNWFFRKYNPKFVAKIELGKGIPSVSYNLKHGGAALINRKDPKQAISALVDYAKRVNENNWAAVIFPEGTRSRTGKPKPFATNGLKVLTKHNPNGYVVPVTINNSWKVFKYGKFPLGIGSPMTITTHKPLKISGMSFETLLQETEAIIKEHVVV